MIVSISGNLASNPKRTKFKCCNNYEEFLDEHENRELINFFEINDHTLGLICKNNDIYDIDLRHNGYLYSEIIARGRQKLDKLLKTIQLCDYARVLYCDCDSVILM